MKSVLITGSEGYLGSVLVPFLIDKGFKVTGIDTCFFNKYSLIDKNIKNNKNYKFFKLDVRDIDEKHLKGIDIVVHLAGISNDPMNKMDSAKVYDPTRIYSKKLAEICKSLGIRFIFASSCSVYGVGNNDLLDESSNVNPQTGYSLNKYQIESDLEELSDPNFSPIALRFATVFGPSPNMRFDIVINMLVGMAITSNKIILNSDGQSWRPNLHIKDLCNSIYKSIQLEYKDGKLLVINIGDEMNNLKIIDIAKLVQDSLPGSKLEFLSENPNIDSDNLIKDRKVNGKDTRTYKVSFSKVRKTLPSFSCEYSVEKGIKNMIEIFREIKLDNIKYKNKCFYRLQQLEHLLNTNQISDDLRWKNSI
tara:strand:+ start:2945 stop:4033 length:1089 start_codon:yes stop_codon:yes gene_type:complete